MLNKIHFTYCLLLSLNLKYLKSSSHFFEHCRLKDYASQSFLYIYLKLTTLEPSGDLYSREILRKCTYFMHPLHTSVTGRETKTFFYRIMIFQIWPFTWFLPTLKLIPPKGDPFFGLYWRMGMDG